MAVCAVVVVGTVVGVAIMSSVKDRLGNLERGEKELAGDLRGLRPDQLEMFLGWISWVAAGRCAGLMG